MGKNILVVLQGTPGEAVLDAYQVLQREAANAEGRRTGHSVEIVMAPAWDQLRVIRKRLGDDAAAPLDAIVVEPASASGIDLLLQAVQGRSGLVFTNSWDPAVDGSAPLWREKGMPLGTMSVDYRRIGEIQARQVAKMLPGGGEVLCVTGPQRASSVADRRAGFTALLPAGLAVHEAEAGGWLEADGRTAFAAWYRLGQSRPLDVRVIAAHSDELAVGAREASREVPNAGLRTMFAAARVLGMDACPGFGRRLVDSGALAASVTTPATTGPAIAGLDHFWRTGEPLPMQALAGIPEPYPSHSA